MVVCCVYMEPIKLWKFSMQPSQVKRVLAEFDGINEIWEVGLLRMRAWSVETSILAFCKVGGGDRVGGGGQAR